MKHRVAHELRTIVDDANRHRCRLHKTHLPLAEVMATRQHIGNEKVLVAIIDPQAIGGGEVTANVQVRVTVPVDIVKTGRETPVARRSRRSSILIQKCR